MPRSAALLCVLVLAAACSSTGAAVSDPRSATASRPSTSETDPGAVPKVLDFTAPSVDGDTVEGADYVGKDLAIWFWAPW